MAGSKDYSKFTVVQLRDMVRTRGEPTTGLTRKALLIERLEQLDDAANATITSTSDENNNGAEIVADPVQTHTGSPPADNGDKGDVATAEEQIPSKEDENVAASLANGAPNHVADMDSKLQNRETTQDVEAQEPVVDETAGIAEKEVAQDESKASDQAEVTRPEPLLSRSNSMESRKRKRRSVTPSLSETEIAAKRAKHEEKGASVVLQEDITLPGEGSDGELKTETNQIYTSASKLSLEKDVEMSMDTETNQKINRGDVVTEPTQASADLKQSIETEQTNHEEVIQEEREEKDSSDAQRTRPSSPMLPTKLSPRSQNVLKSVQSYNSEQMEVEVGEDASIPNGSTLDKRIPRSPTAPTKLSPAGHDRFRALTRTLTNSSAPPLSKESDGANDILDGGQIQMQERERDVQPAIHPATNTLYITNLMRPLRDTSLRIHLASLSLPLSSDPPSGPKEELANTAITAFHLDTLKTHCFATFTSTAAASRVRNGLHGIRWPDEGSRKELWVDFLPESRIKEWIAVEVGGGGGSGGGGRRNMKRWEIVYVPAQDSQDPSSVNAELREILPGATPAAQSNAGLSRGLEASTGTTNTQIRGIAAASSASDPTTATTATRTSASASNLTAKWQDEIEKEKAPSFLALDSLFRSTTSKPKLYYLPVSKEITNERVEILQRETSRRADTELIRKGGAGLWDSRRFTFERTASDSNGRRERDEGNEQRLVDGGPEFGMRGAVRGRGIRGGARAGREVDQGGSGGGVGRSNEGSGVDRSTYGGRERPYHGGSNAGVTGGRGPPRDSQGYYGRNGGGWRGR